MMGTRRLHCNCRNFILLVPLCWLPFHLYLHFGHRSSETTFRQFDTTIRDGSLDHFIASRVKEDRQGAEKEEHYKGDRSDAELRGNYPADGHADWSDLTRRDRHRADDTEFKRREEDLPVLTHLHGNKANVVKLTVRRKVRRPQSSEDDNRSNNDSERTLKSPMKLGTFDLRHQNRPHRVSGTSKQNSHDKGSLPFRQTGYEWREDGPGEMGQPVHLSPAEQRRADATFDVNRFNLVASERVALNRTLPDVRPPRCRTLRYPVNLPRTSVIIVFHNEAWSTLLRTVTSVINRSPPALLEEVILVDDASRSQCDWLQEPLEDYVASLPVPVRVERLKSRQGVVAARHLGVSVSKGEVLTFLDSHCECTTGWLEPLLERISRDRTRVPSPVIDSISDTTFAYKAAPGMARVGGFSWLPEFTWAAAPLREQRRVGYDTHLPLRTPTMAGGLFSIHRDFFHRLGGYDAGMRIWGGENLQLSFKVWQCGGSLEIVPCSHVGHVFRSTTPHGFPLGAEATVLRNNRRLLEVWTDEFTRELFYAMTPAYRAVDYGDVGGEIALRDRLGCRGFQWYLENVYPEHDLPLKFRVLGAIKNLGINMCLDGIASRKDGKRDIETDAVLDLCHGSGPGQVFAYNMRNQLQHGRQCLTVRKDRASVQLTFCVGDERTNANQHWTYNTKEMALVNDATQTCLDVQPAETEDGLFIATTNDCDGALSQQWTMHNITIKGFS